MNYRGSTGYGQAFADAIFGDHNGKEAENVLSAFDAVIAKYPWVDSTRLGIEGGTYGGQLTNWLITRTPRFKAAVPRGRNCEPRELQLHGVPPRLSRRGIRRVSA